MKIWKYELKLGRNEIMMPLGATVGHGAEQNGKMFLWAHVDPKAKEICQIFEVIGTGWETPPNGQYAGTMVMSNGFVWHVFWLPEGDQLPRQVDAN